MANKLMKWAVVATTAGVIFVNYLAATGVVNDKTTGELSDKYTTAITPAGYAFTIWSVIYLGLIVFSIFQLLPGRSEEPRLARIRGLYIFNGIGNCLWILAWHYELVPLSLGIMAALLLSLLAINAHIARCETAAELITTKIPFNIYFGWITLATILNATITLVYFGVSLPPLATSLVGSALIVVAALLGVFVRFRLSAAAYPVAIAWGITAIAVANGGNTAIVVSSAVAVIVLLLAALAGALRE